MKSITLTQFGPPDVLKLTTATPKPTPSPTQLLVRVKATALNRADLLQRRGKYPPPAGESEILGLEIAGEVAEIGAKVTNFKPGDRVFGLVGGGAYAEYCVIDSQCALPIPDNLTAEQAAATAEAFFTANEAVFTLGQLQANEKILIHAGASGVGSACMQLAHLAGAEVYATAGSNDKIEKISHLGASKIINYKTDDFATAFSHGVDVIIDFVGTDYLDRNLKLLHPNGRLIQVGIMSGARAEIDLSLLLTKRLQLKGLTMRTQSLENKRAITHRFQEKWLPLLAAGKIKPIIDSVYRLEDIQSAHTYMETNKNVGKIVIRVD